VIEPVVASARGFAEDGDHGEAQEFFPLPVAVAGIEDIPDGVVGVKRAENHIAVACRCCDGEDFGGLIVTDVEVVVDAVVGAQREKRTA